MWPEFCDPEGDLLMRDCIVQCIWNIRHFVMVVQNEKLFDVKSIQKCIWSAAGVF